MSLHGSHAVRSAPGRSEREAAPIVGFGREGKGVVSAAAPCRPQAGPQAKGSTCAGDVMAFRLLRTGPEGSARGTLRLMAPTSAARMLVTGRVWGKKDL